MRKFVEHHILNGIRVEVVYRRVALPRSAKYFVVASRGAEELPPFEIKFDYDHWKPVQPVPFWVEGQTNVLLRTVSRIEKELAA